QFRSARQRLGQNVSFGICQVQPVDPDSTPRGLSVQPLGRGRERGLALKDAYGCRSDFLVCLFGVSSVREESAVAPVQDKQTSTAAEAAQIADIGKVRNHESVQTFLDQGGSSTLQPRLIVHAEEFISANWL